MNRKNALELASMVERYNAGVYSQSIVEDYQQVANVLRQQHERLMLLEQALRDIVALRVNADKCQQQVADMYEKMLLGDNALTSIDMQRKAFEQWAESEGFNLDAYDDGEYVLDTTYFAWKAWQAAQTNDVTS